MVEAIIVFRVSTQKETVGKNGNEVYKIVLKLSTLINKRFELHIISERARPKITRHWSFYKSQAPH